MIRLERAFLTKVWGSNSLRPWFDDAAEKIGEVWFTHTPPLRLLVKFIFTSGRLSVQVHPDDDYAARHALASGKTEMWHVLRAEPGAVIAAGFRETISRERARQAALSGEIVELLQWWPVRPGDTFYIPAGTVHAISAGVVLCEIQQNCDLTYRFYDYGRPRELHLDQALEVAQLTPTRGPTRLRGAGEGVRELAASKYFVTDLVEAGRRGLDLTRAEEQILVVLEGSGSFSGDRFTAGEAWLVPPGHTPAVVQPETAVRLLRTYVPEAGSRQIPASLPQLPFA
jgi:mannose-6-phosphate isomerase